MQMDTVEGSTVVLCVIDLKADAQQEYEETWND